MTTSQCMRRCYKLKLVVRAQFTKYPTTILRFSYDNANVTFDLYDGRPIYKTSYEGSNAILRYDSLAKL